MDHRKRKWIVSNKWDEYLSGVNEFLNFAFRDDENGKVPCPCQRCVNRFSRSREEVFTHLVEHRMLEGYDTWYCHGESLSDFIQVQNLNVDEGVTGHNDNQSTDKDMMEMLHDIFGAPTQPRNMDLDENLVDDLQLGDVAENSSAFLPHDIQRFNDFIKDVDSELYPGCKKFNRLSFLLHLYHIKCRYGWSNTSFDALVKLLKEAFPDGATLRSSFRESQKIVDGLGLNYEKIDACPNDCMLFWKDKVNDEECSICHASRWKDGDKNENASVRKKKKIPAKVLRYFPLKPRLQRLFMSSKIANDMTWHENERKKDGVLRHPADSKAWKCLDTNFPDFHAEPRNVRLGLATDGFNPFGRMDNTHSIWPVIVIPYNLTPWLCMKKENFILSLLIPGPKSPGNDIDVYLQPLIEELVELWELGAPTLDASTGEVFQMHAALLWTINDFPALGNLSGWNVYSEFGCPSCNVETHSKRLKYGHKFCFMDHDRFLNDLTASRPPSGEKVLEQLKNINFTFGKLSDEASGVPDGTWKKKSEFLKLPYWKHLLIRHNLDMMHVEKNVCDNIVNTLLNIEKKSKDNLSARRDLKKLRIRKRLWPQRRGQSGRWFLPPACFNMNKERKKIFYQVLENVKFPDGYASNISRCVKKHRTLAGLKSHDCHVLMQCLLPIALRGNLDDKVVSVLVELCNIFRVLCGKTLYVHELDLLEQKAARVLCCLEKIFLPSFFTIMVHLVIHLVYEAKVAGPVHYRWMYPIERYLKTLKSFVRNKARPEGSIAEAYLAEECLTFCSRYLKGLKSRSHSRNNADNEEVEHIEDNEPDILFPVDGKPYGNIRGFKMDEKMWKQAHRYILFNCEDQNIDSLRKDHMSHINRITRRRRPSQREKELLHNEEFSDWLKDYVNDPQNANDERITSKVKSLGRGPNHIARKFQAYDVNNGYRFRTKEYEKEMSTQNSGVVVVAKTQSYASSSDTRPFLGDLSYYGRVTSIIEIDYFGDFKVVLFGCDWVDVVQGRGVKKDSLGCTLVNFGNLIHTGARTNDEPFVFPSQVQQVIYVQDPREIDWFAPVPMKPRDIYDLGEDDDQFYHESTLFSGSEPFYFGSGEYLEDVDNDLTTTVGLEGTYVDDNSIQEYDEENENS